MADPSWGDPDAPRFEARNITTVEAGGIKVRVHRELAELVTYLLGETVRRGYQLVGDTPDDWAYCNRCIRGTGPGTRRPCVKSNHSWGCALDLNAVHNPMTEDGVVHTNMPDWMVRLWAAWGFSWGGGYSHNRKDPMHYEFTGGKDDARRLTVALRTMLAHPTPPKPRKPAPRKNPHKAQAAGTVVGLGAHGEHVEFIQWALRISEDGDFGPQTVAAVKRFQQAHGLKADGKVGEQTLRLLAAVTR